VERGSLLVEEGKKVLPAGLLVELALSVPALAAFKFPEADLEEVVGVVLESMLRKEGIHDFWGRSGVGGSELNGKGFLRRRIISAVDLSVGLYTADISLCSCKRPVLNPRTTLRRLSIRNCLAGHPHLGVIVRRLWNLVEVVVRTGFALSGCTSHWLNGAPPWLD
jgi:hypothetical protein